MSANKAITNKDGDTTQTCGDCREWRQTSWGRDIGECGDVGHLCGRHIDACVRFAPRRDTGPAAQTEPHIEATGMPERELQEGCEAYLRGRGYQIPTARAFSLWRRRRTHVKGWYWHLHGQTARGVAQMPDLCVVDPKWTRILAIELKTRDAWQPGQREAVAQGAWYVVSRLWEFKQHVEAWEGNGEA